MTDDSNMYACLYGLTQAWSSSSTLEIGTGFGLSAMAMRAAKPDTKLITIDTGGFMGFANIQMARDAIGPYHSARTLFCRTDTQKLWYQDSGLVDILTAHYPFDLLFVDGRHKGDGLFHDLYSFWPFVRPGGLVICDDIHDPEKYPQFDWVPDTWNCFHAFLKTPGIDWADQCIWDFPFVPSGRRPLGLIVKE